MDAHAEIAARGGLDSDDARLRLQELCEIVTGAQCWPWEDDTIDLHRTCILPYLCGLLEDEMEAADWAFRFDAEIARLEAAASDPLREMPARTA